MVYGHLCVHMRCMLLYLLNFETEYKVSFDPDVIDIDDRPLFDSTKPD